MSAIATTTARASLVCLGCVVAAVAWNLVPTLARGQCFEGPDAFPTEQLLLSLQFKEQALLENYGVDHPEVIAVRTRLATVRACLASHPVPAPRPLPAEIIPAMHVQPIPAPNNIAKHSMPRTVPEETVGKACCDEHAKKEKGLGVVKPPRESAIVDPIPNGVSKSSRMEKEDNCRQTGSFPIGSWVQWTVAPFALFLGLLTQGIAVVLVLRRFKALWPSPLRIELVGAAIPHVSEPAHCPKEIGLPPAAISIPAREPVLPPAPPGPEEGAKYLNVLGQKEEAHKQQEAAIFHQILEQNLHLHAQLRAANSGDAS